MSNFLTDFWKGVIVALGVSGAIFFVYRVDNITRQEVPLEV
jgi:hypothetical protein